MISGESESAQLLSKGKFSYAGNNELPGETMTYIIPKVPAYKIVHIEISSSDEDDSSLNESVPNESCELPGQTKITEYFKKKKYKAGQEQEKDARERGKKEPEIKKEKKKRDVNLMVGDVKGPMVVGNHNTINVGPGKQIMPYQIHHEEKYFEAIAAISAKLYYFRDNGLWFEFDDAVKHMLSNPSKYLPFDDCEIFIMVEHSIALSYKAEYGKSKQILEEAKDLIFNTPGLLSKEIAVALYKIQESALLRRDKKYSEARKAVMIAEQNMSYVISMPFLNALLFYELGNVFCVDNGSVASEQYKKCIDSCQQHKQDFPDQYIERDTFCYAKLGEISLSSQSGRSKDSPSHVNVHDAELYAKKIQDKGDNIPRAMKMMGERFLSSYYAVVKNDKQGALESIEKAKMTSSEIGFHVQQQDLEERRVELVEDTQADTH